jgi:hypothetical protein
MTDRYYTHVLMDGETPLETFEDMDDAWDEMSRRENEWLGQLALDKHRLMTQTYRNQHELSESDARCLMDELDEKAKRSPFRIVTVQHFNEGDEA